MIFDTNPSKNLQKSFFDSSVQFILTEKMSLFTFFQRFFLSKSKMFWVSLRRELTVQQLLSIRNRSL